MHKVLEISAGTSRPDISRRRMGRRGKREFVQVLRLLENFREAPLPDACAGLEYGESTPGGLPRGWDRVIDHLVAVAQCR